LDHRTGRCCCTEDKETLQDGFEGSLVGNECGICVPVRYANQSDIENNKVADKKRNTSTRRQKAASAPSVAVSPSLGSPATALSLLFLPRSPHTAPPETRQVARSQTPGPESQSPEPQNLGARAPLDPKPQTPNPKPFTLYHYLKAKTFVSTSPPTCHLLQLPSSL